MRCGKLPIFYLEIHGHPWENRWSITSFCSNSAEMGTFTCLPLFFGLFFAGVPWQMTSGTKALALKNWKAFASREGALLCSAGADTARLFRHTARLFRHLNKSASQKNEQPQAGCVKHRCLTDIKRQRCFFVGSGAAIFLGSVTRIFQNLAKWRASVCVMHAQNPDIHDASAVFSESR